MANVKHLASPAGLLQIVHLVFGIIAIGCGAASYESHFFRERFFFWSVVALLIVTVIFLVINVITGNQAVRAASSGTHVIGGLLLIAAGSLMIMNVNHIDDICSPNPWDADCEFEKPVKLAAASFAIINGILYLAASALFVMIKNEEENTTYLQPERKTFARPTKQ